jgi:RNA polymerase sigma factor (TIGR02999 family)
MDSLNGAQITLLLNRWKSGDEQAYQEVIAMVYRELHQIAHGYLKRERAADILQTTALVNEAYLRLVGVQDIEWQGRTHFFSIAAKLMRQILVDFARQRQAQKRGGRLLNVPLEGIEVQINMDLDSLIKIDELLQSLARLDERQALVVEMRVFGGMTNDEIATVLQVNERTVKRDWRLARAWLASELTPVTLVKTEEG